MLQIEGNFEGGDRKGDCENWALQGLIFVKKLHLNGNKARRGEKIDENPS
jgi:hypothetical protein